jgi:hypothetical protein
MFLGKDMRVPDRESLTCGKKGKDIKRRTYCVYTTPATSPNFLNPSSEFVRNWCEIFSWNSKWRTWIMSTPTFVFSLAIRPSLSVLTPKYNYCIAPSWEMRQWSVDGTTLKPEDVIKVFRKTCLLLATLSSANATGLLRDWTRASAAGKLLLTTRPTQCIFRKTWTRTLFWRPRILSRVSS